MRTLVTGGRDYNDRVAAYTALDALHARYPISCIIHGDARGSDSLCRDWAISRGIPHEAYPADWESYGKAAGAIRNGQMLLAGPQYCVAFPGGRGTADMVRKAKLHGLMVYEPYK
jgi:hypothetical protein